MEECHKLLTDQVDNAILRPALSISKMKVAYYPDVGLEQLVPDQFWIAEECKYDIAAIYGDRRAVRTHMRILSVVRIEVFSMYGYNYMKNIVLRQADLKEYVIAERDFKHMYPSDFEDLYQTQLNLTKPRWEATGFEFKHDYTVIDSPRAVTFRDRYGVQMIMRTNPGMNTKFWTKKDVDRSKDFMFAIQKRLKTRCVFRNLESFVGGRIREGDYRDTKYYNEDGNPSRADIKQAAWSVLTDPEDQAKIEMESPRSSGVNSPPNAHTYASK
ncbi:hypothetical protein Tco_0972828 [Tanacetum coccineum]